LVAFDYGGACDVDTQDARELPARPSEMTGRAAWI
jgi:hypothetical protein